MTQADFQPYIFFTGNCREAMEFYKEVFGGELTMQTYDEMPGGNKMPNTEGKIMHSQLKGGVIDFMASDSTRTEPFGQSFISLCIMGSDEAALTELFNKLAEGGEVTMPLSKEFWGDLFGTVTDKFGVEWMVNIPKDGE